MRRERNAMMNDIKRCPFCGGKAEIETKYSAPNGAYYSAVTCTKCHSRSKTAKTTNEPEIGELRNIIVRWNSRVPESDSNED